MANDNWVRSFISGCLSKAAYPSMWRAKQVAERVYEETGLKLYSYMCPDCGLVHLTKRKTGDSHLQYISHKKHTSYWEKEQHTIAHAA